VCVVTSFTACFDLLADVLHVVFVKKSLRILKPTLQNAVDFTRQNNVTSQRTKVPRVWLFNVI